MRRQTLRTPNIEDCVVRSVRKEEIPICFDFGRGRGKWSFCSRLISLYSVVMVVIWGCVMRMDMTGVDDDRGMGVDWDGWGWIANGWKCGRVL